ncbi:MAG: DmsE family decaheme c-type cytochrome [Nitrospirae bacterium]|nr:DmsE family decaheme c-type cytochrome [Nitrospirota bacterium]MCL5236479.1 DmsE family decaheme c-type cytochrome [Nitrospirota bacterium]
MGEVKRRFMFLLMALFVFLFVFLSAMLFQKGAEGNAGYAGVTICKGCHEGHYESYASSIHAKKAIPGNPANREACESCHGPGASHVEKGGGKGTGIFTFNRKANAEEKSSRCLSCHEESQHLAFWNMSRHKSAGVSCDNCHSIHAGKDKNLKDPEPVLCYGCHRAVNFQANKQSHHPINEGKVRCSDCHDPHGAFGEKMVKADSVNELCYKCHAEKRGPFMFQHPPVDENCLICHTVHGSNHTRLLNKKTPQLCQSCHELRGHPGTPYTKFDSFGETPSNKLVGRSCLNCHSNIHGSNGPSTHGLNFVR